MTRIQAGFIALMFGALMFVVGRAGLAETEHLPTPSAKPAITLAPSAVPDSVRIQRKEGEASFESAPANFHAFASARAGEIADEEQLTLNFHASTQLTKIESTKDFFVDPASGCQVGNRYDDGDRCILLVRFTPQGAGRRLGKLTISHTASPQPLALGLGGNGYAPVLSFTPALITTVPGTYPSSKGLLSGAQNLAVDGSDSLYVADTGNGIIRYMDSSGTFTSLAASYSSPLGIAVDNTGNVYFDEPALNLMYEIDAYGTVFQMNGTGTDICDVSTPCSLEYEAVSDPGALSIDLNSNLFFPEATHGAAMSTVQPIPPSLIDLSDPFPVFDVPPTAIAVDSSDNLYSFWTTPFDAYCEIQQQSVYNAESFVTIYNKVAGGRICGFSGDGGQAGNAEIGGSIAQMSFDIAGNLYFSDTNNQRVRRIDASTGQINTIAGNGIAGYTGDNSQATSAELKAPTGVAIDSQGQVYIVGSATTGQVIRKLGPNGFLAFGNQLMNASSTGHLVTVTNTGNSTMTLTRAYIGGNNPGDFTIDPNLTSCNLTAGAALDAGASCKVEILFKPAAAGTRTGDLYFLDNTVTNLNIVQLSGTGTLPTPTFKITAPAPSATETSGTAFTFSVSVTSASGPQPTGTVTMLLNGTAISGSPATLNGSGVASLSVTSTTLGTNTLSATYNGDSNYSADGPITETVTVNAPAKQPVTIAVKSSANPATLCSEVAFSVTVTGSGSERPTGTVKLMRGPELLGEASLDRGTAKLQHVPMNVGANVLTAHYDGDSKHEPATSEPFRQVVSPDDSASVRRLPLPPVRNPIGAVSR